MCLWFCETFCCFLLRFRDSSTRNTLMASDSESRNIELRGTSRIYNTEAPLGTPISPNLHNRGDLLGCYRPTSNLSGRQYITSPDPSSLHRGPLPLRDLPENSESTERRTYCRCSQHQTPRIQCPKSCRNHQSAPSKSPHGPASQQSPPISSPRTHDRGLDQRLDASAVVLTLPEQPNASYYAAVSTIMDRTPNFPYHEYEITKLCLSKRLKPLDRCGGPIW